MYKRYIKRLLDIFFSLLILLILSPIMMIVAFMIKFKLGSPIIFKQDRPGKNEKIFTMYKFRTMTDERDENGELLPDSIRLTRFGRFLRSTSLDEFPELVNIIKGDMSLVGPRPLAVIYLPYYNNEEKLRHTVRPGLTGLAQINGRNTVGWEERFQYDINYVNNITFKTDLIIMFQTFLKVFKREGVAVRGTTKVTDFHTYRQAQIREEEKVSNEHSR
ncbi:sugar transferase [Priestia endophytica]